MLSHNKFYRSLAIHQLFENIVTQHITNPSMLNTVVGFAVDVYVKLHSNIGFTYARQTIYHNNATLNIYCSIFYL